MAEVELRNNPPAFRYEAFEGDELVSHIDYLLDDNVVRVTHTSTPPKYRGRGLAGRLTEFALDDIRARGLRLQPLCSFTATYVADHPEYAALVVRR